MLVIAAKICAYHRKKHENLKNHGKVATNNRIATINNMCVCNSMNSLPAARLHGQRIFDNQHDSRSRAFPWRCPCSSASKNFPPESRAPALLSCPKLSSKFQSNTWDGAIQMVVPGLLQMIPKKRIYTVFMWCFVSENGH